MKKQIQLNGESTSFWVYDNGMLQREDTGHWYKPFDNGGYLSYYLKWKGKTYPFRVHRLLAIYFIPNPDNKPFVRHKDHDHYNNNLNNLEWVTVKENNQDRLKPAHPPVAPKNYDYANEHWKQYLDTEFYVSDLGRVKNIRTRNYLRGNVRENGYLRVGLRYNGKIHSFNVHNLVWQVWRGPQKNVIDHINGDKLDNRLSNLQDITQSENLQKASRKAMPIGNSVEKNGPIVKVYTSQAAAARAYNINSGNINHALHGGYRAAGYYWRFLTEEDYV